MPDSNMKRGRPKGSGLDDRKHLHIIAARIRADGSLKPTTAIRALGICDPSVIRRLRDKYKVLEGELMASLAAAETGLAAAATGAAPARPLALAGAGATLADAPPMGGALMTRELNGNGHHSTGVHTIARPLAPTHSPTPPRSIALALPSEQARREPPRHESAAVPDAGLAPRRREPLSPTSEWLANLYGLSLAASTSAFESQLALMRQLLTLPPVAIAIGNQVAFNQLALSMCPGKPATRAMLH